jgi:hypothetical protein
MEMKRQDEKSIALFILFPKAGKIDPPGRKDLFLW